jgi:hypothetical protein
MRHRYVCTLLFSAAAMSFTICPCGSSRANGLVWLPSSVSSQKFSCEPPRDAASLSVLTHRWAGRGRVVWWTRLFVSLLIPMHSGRVSRLPIPICLIVLRRRGSLHLHISATVFRLTITYTHPLYLTLSPSILPSLPLPLPTSLSLSFTFFSLPLLLSPSLAFSYLLSVPLSISLSLSLSYSHPL